MIPLKQFCAEEAHRAQSSLNAIYLRIRAGRYPGIILYRKNRNVVFVLNQPSYSPVRKRHPDLKGHTDRSYQRLYMRKYRLTHPRRKSST